MIRILPDMQVSPAGGIFMWLFIVLVVLGLTFSTGLGGAIVWAVFWIIMLFLGYLILKKLARRVF